MPLVPLRKMYQLLPYFCYNMLSTRMFPFIRFIASEEVILVFNTVVF